MDFKEEWSEPEEALFEHFRFEVPKGQGLMRIDKYLQLQIPNISRNKLQNAADSGQVLVNETAVKSNYKVKPDDIIRIVLAHPPFEHKIIPEDIPLDIVYEDDALVVINKPPGLVVHPGHGNYTGTLV
ncbi:MAG: S4 domain-containing protein, partial [Flavobacterium sp.]